MMRNLRLLLSLITGLILFSLTSCHSSRRAATGNSAIGDGGSPKERLASLASYYTAHPLGAYSAPTTVAITSPVKTKISGTLSVVPSRYIHFSARFLGMEVGTLMITPDSVFGKIKPGKKYIAESLDAVAAVLPVTLDQIQDLIAGRIIIPGHDEIDRKAISTCRFTSGEELWTVTPADSRGKLDVSFSLSTATNRLFQVNAVAPRKASTLVTLTDYQSTLSGDLPGNININVITGDHSISADLDMNLSKLKTDISADRNWSAPRGYSKVSPADIIRILANL